MGAIYYNRYPGDYRRDTGHLDLMQHGAYCLMLDAYYSTGRPLPASLDALVRIVGAQGKAERMAVESVADEFFPVSSDGFRHNQRCDRELERREEYSAKQANKGRRSVEAKRQQRLNSGSTTAEQRLNSGSTKPQPDVNPPSPSPSPSPSPKPDPSPPPESVKPTAPTGRGGIAWSGSVLVVDGEAHAQFRRLYDEQWLLEQYPQIDVKLAVLSTAADPWGAHRALGYATTWLTRARIEAKAKPAPTVDTRPKCSRCKADPATETGGLCRVCAKAVERGRHRPQAESAGDVARDILESLKSADEGEQDEPEDEEAA